MCAKIAYGFLKKRSTVSSVCSLSCKKIKETGILIDKPKRVKPKTVRTPDNIAAVAESVCEAPHRRSQQLNISEIIFSDKAHFDVGGYVNKQNCRI